MDSLADWEKDLREKIDYIELLGELNLSQDDVRQIGSLIANLFCTYDQSTTLHILKRRYAVCLAVYLVAKGIYGYQGGDYWTSIKEEIGLTSGNIQQQVGPCFEQFLLDQGLPSFPGVRGLRYVRIILLHGGIPDYSLRDFFEHFLYPAISNPDFSGLNVKDLISVWLKRGMLYAVDKPIPRFLEHGGKIAMDFVSRSVDMALYFTKYGKIPPIQEIGLPQRVIEAYQTWAKVQTRSTQSSKVRLERPEIILDPWGSGPLVHLPAQFLSLYHIQLEGAWTLRGDFEDFIIPLHFHWRNNIVETDIYQVQLPRSSSEYTISFTVGSAINRTWQFRGTTASTPLMIFEPKTRSLVQF